jgi:hypothetical protein
MNVDYTESTTKTSPLECFQPLMDKELSDIFNVHNIRMLVAIILII